MNLAALGLVLGIVGNLWIVVLCFQTGILWGLGSLFVPPVGLLFCILNIRETWKPLLLAVVGWGLFLSHAGQAAGGV
jgi:hypothetical protein